MFTRLTHVFCMASCSGERMALSHVFFRYHNVTASLSGVIKLGKRTTFVVFMQKCMVFCLQIIESKKLIKQHHTAAAAAAASEKEFCAARAFPRGRNAKSSMKI